MKNNFYLLVIICSLSFSCESKAQKGLTKNYLLVNQILENTKEQNLNKTLVFNLNNNNEYVISILKQLHGYELEKNTFKLDSLKQSIGVIQVGRERDSIFDYIFNKKQYKYLISQKCNSEWEFNLIDTLYLKKTNSKKKQSIKISKPIYTKNNDFALVVIDRVSSISVSVYKKEQTNWVEYRLIAPAFVSPKIKHSIYKD